ncbi:MAG: Gldg family protein [Clostridia bacterium]|nr:Gldg family protein [Clostridia bacterium]
MRRSATSRRFRYGSLSVILTICVIAVVVITNVIFQTLAQRYSWYIDMTASGTFTLSDDCCDYVADNIIPLIDADNAALTEDQKIRIIFCDDKAAWEEELVQEYLLNTATELAEEFPDHIEIEFINIWNHPSLAKKYNVYADTNVVIAYGDRFVLRPLNDFYVFNSADTETPIAYNGEKSLATGILHVAQKNTPMAYLTVNHGETLYDNSFLNLLVDAGYRYSYLDLMNFEIPEDCELLITYNPVKDFAVNDGISVKDEIVKLDAYMENGGAYMVFVNSDTFVAGSFVNFETFLEGWGIDFMHTEVGGIEHCYTVKDTSQSLSVDGYTVLGSYTTTQRGANIAQAAGYSPVVFSGATCISPATGFTATGQGTYQKDGCTLSPILTSSESAEAWAGGAAAAYASAENPFIMMTLSEKQVSGGTGYILTCTSTAFANEDALNSPVYGNGSVLLASIETIGNDRIPTALTSKPFADSTIDTITVAQKTYITVVLATVPALIAFATGLIILIRRKHA